jgi:uncharacterized tellurite resistance protein B-like protein
MEQKDKIQICKVVAQAILADAQITDSERELLEKLMDRYELDDDQRKEVLNRNLDDDAAAMASEISAEEPKNELLVELAMAVAVDGEIAKSERELLDRVAEALSIAKPDLELLLGAAIS